jgi:DNA gyrase subunit B
MAMALSQRLDVTVWRDGRTCAQTFGLGVVQGPVRDLGPSGGRTGTRITYTPDFTIFPRT